MRGLRLATVLLLGATGGAGLRAQTQQLSFRDAYAKLLTRGEDPCDVPGDEDAAKLEDGLFADADRRR